MESDPLIYTENPTIAIGSTTFRNVAQILVFEDSPLIEVAKVVEGGYTTQFYINHSDGTPLAKVVGSRLFKTEAGEKAGIALRHPDLMTVCELNGKTIFELRREEAAALKTSAELFTTTGEFIKATDQAVGLLKMEKESPLTIGSMQLSSSHFEGCRIGIQVKRDGSIGLGIGGGSVRIGSLKNL